LEHINTNQITLINQPTRGNQAMTDQIKDTNETVVLDSAMIAEGKALAQIWTRRQASEAKRFDGDIVDPVAEVLDDDGNVIVESVTGGFDRRLGKLLVAIHSTLDEGKYIPKATAKAYGLDKIDSQRKSDARKWEDMGEEMRTLLIEEYPAIKSLQRLVAKYAKMMKEESAGEGEGEDEGESEGEGETENNITLNQVLALIASSDLDKNAYKAIVEAAYLKAKNAHDQEKVITQAA
jgi:hypothetical protein